MREQRKNSEQHRLESEIDSALPQSPSHTRQGKTFTEWSGRSDIFVKLLALHGETAAPKAAARGATPARPQTRRLAATNSDGKNSTGERENGMHPPDHRTVVRTWGACSQMLITRDSFCTRFRSRSPCLMAAWYCAFFVSGRVDATTPVTLSMEQERRPEEMKAESSWSR